MLTKKGLHLKETSKLNSGGEHTSMTQLHIATSALFLYYYYYFWSGGLEWDRRFGAVLLITHSGTGRHGEVSFFHVPKKEEGIRIWRRRGGASRREFGFHVTVC